MTAETTDQQCMHGTFECGKWREPPGAMTKGCFLSGRIHRAQVGDDLLIRLVRTGG